jgi:hypothetical protein
VETRDEEPGLSRVQPTIESFGARSERGQPAPKPRTSRASVRVGSGRGATRSKIRDGTSFGSSRKRSRSKPFQRLIRCELRLEPDGTAEHLDDLGMLASRPVRRAVGVPTELCPASVGSREVRRRQRTDPAPGRKAHPLQRGVGIRRGPRTVAERHRQPGAATSRVVFGSRLACSSQVAGTTDRLRVDGRSAHVRTLGRLRPERRSGAERMSSPSGFGESAP